MKRMYKWLKLLLLFMTVLIVSCNNQDPTLVQPTARVTCSGWVMHVVNVTKSAPENGWVIIEGNIAFENIYASITDSVPLDQLLSSMVMNTDQGFSYPIDSSNIWAFVGDIKKVPPGFLYIGPTVNFRVASGTTGHKVQTGCGILDFDNPETNLEYPTSISNTHFRDLGTSIKLPKGVLSFTSVVDNNSDCLDDSTCLHYSFENTDKGYDTDYYLTILVIGSDGVLNYLNNYGIQNNLHIYAGPGQTIEGDLIFSASTKQGRKLLVMSEIQYWIYNIP